MAELLPAYEIDLFEVRRQNLLREEELSADFFADSSYYGATDLQMHLHLEATFSCTRCLSGVRVPLEYDGILEVRATAETEENLEDEVWQISSAREALDLADYIRESLYLSLPMSVNHGDFGTNATDCDAQMLDYILKEEKGISLGNICGEEFAKLEKQLLATSNERKKKEE